MTRKIVILIILTALIISAAQLILNPYRTYNRSMSLSIGQIADHDVISPLEFSVYKSRVTLKQERDIAEQEVNSIYKLSDNITFNAIRNLDIIFRHFEVQEESIAIDKLMDFLHKKGYHLEKEAIEYLADTKNRSRVYEYLSQKIARILDVGIYPESYSKSQISVVRKGELKDYHLFKLYAYDEARDKIIDGYQDPAGKKAVASLADNILVVNIIIDKEATEAQVQKARMGVSLTAGKVLKNETIIRKGERVNETHLQKLVSMQKALQQTNEKSSRRWVILSILGTFIIIIFLLFIFFKLLHYMDNPEINLSRILLILCQFILVSLFTLIINNVLQLSSLFIPLSFFSLTILKLVNKKVSFLYSVIQLILVSLLLNWNFINPLLITTATFSILLVSNRDYSLSYLKLTIFLTAFYLIFNLGISLNQVTNITEFWQRLWMGSVSMIISAVLAIILIPYFEKRFKIVTRERLLSLLNLENPLLKRLNKEIPGTYHHSLVVSNLAESAAEAIGANHLLARVGSYYHDIGKLVNSQMFTENNAKSSELHDEMLPTQSAQIIRNHVHEGVLLGREAGLPEIVIDLIIQHHGTSKTKYFLNKAREINQVFDDAEFSYPGPKPQTKEAAIIMIADIVESHSKSLKILTEDIIKNILKDTIDRVINEGQLSDAPITLKELNLISLAMYPILTGVYSSRVEYPQDDKFTDNK